MPSPSKRERQRLNRQSARAAQLEAARRRRRRQGMIRGGVLAALLVILAVVGAAVFGSNDKKEVTAGDQNTTTTASGSSTTVNPALANVTCDERKPEATGDRPTFDKPPAMEIDTAKKYTAVLETSCGKITVDLDPKGAPKTVNNFVVLSRKDFYDGLTWHRVVADFVIQGGDPKGDGTGGPGYQFEDELPKDGYQLGSLAMANSGPNTNGSQFFIVTGPKGTTLPNSYSRFGMVTEGLEVAQKIESFATDDPQGKPSRELYIFNVEITESAA
jgi:cyclophilin family peptidyl-prolyl cis-trans isomerase